MAGVPTLTFTDANNAEAQTVGTEAERRTAALNHRPSGRHGSTCWTQLGPTASGASSLSLGPPGPDAHRQPDVRRDEPRAPPQHAEPVDHHDGLRQRSRRAADVERLPQPSWCSHRHSRPARRCDPGSWPGRPAASCPTRSCPALVVQPARRRLQPGDRDDAAQRMRPSPPRSAASTPTPTERPQLRAVRRAAISWTPNNMADGADWPKPAADDTLHRHGRQRGGQRQRDRPDFTYTVTVIDPRCPTRRTPPGRTQRARRIPRSARTRRYTVPAVPDATGYQWRTTPSTPGDFVDGAENGLGNFTANMSPDYNRDLDGRAGDGRRRRSTCAGLRGAAAPTRRR